MIDMRLRIPELMAARRMPSAYALSKASAGRISMTNAHHLVELEGRTARVDMRTLDALCDVFNVEPGELLEREKKRR